MHGEIPFVTCEAMLEAPAGGNAYGLLRLHADRVEIDGLGTSLRSHSFKLRPQPAPGAIPQHLLFPEPSLNLP
jgi:hypothetical protein